MLFFKKIKKNVILRSSIGIFIITFFVKLLGYFEKILLGFFFGTSYEVDVYTVVLSAVLTFFFFFREVIEPGFLNVFLQNYSQGSSKRWNLFNHLLRFVFLITLCISMAAFAFPHVFVKIFAPGFEGKAKDLTVELIDISFLAIIFLSLSTVTNITLNALKKFALPASGDLAMKVALIITIIIGYSRYGIKAAIFGIVIGAVAKLLVHLTALYKHISLRSIELDKSQVTKMWSISWPMLIGVSVSQLGGIIDNIFASYLREGSISSLAYARKVVELPIVVFPYILSVVVFPFFSELSIQKEKEKLQSLITTILQWITVLFIPLSIFFMIHAQLIVELLLKRGSFDEVSVSMTSDSLFMYSTGMLFFAIETVLVIFYFANTDTKTPIFTGIGCIFLNICLTYILIQWLGFMGIALALVITKFIKVVILLLLLNKKIHVDFKNVFHFVYRLLLAASFTAAFLWAIRLVLSRVNAVDFITRLNILSLHFICGCLFYYLCIRLLSIHKGMNQGDTVQ